MLEIWKTKEIYNAATIMQMDQIVKSDTSGGPPSGPQGGSYGGAPSGPHRGRGGLGYAGGQDDRQPNPYGGGAPVLALSPTGLPVWSSPFSS